MSEPQVYYLAAGLCLATSSYIGLPALMCLLDIMWYNVCGGKE